MVAGTSTLPLSLRGRVSFSSIASRKRLPGNRFRLDIEDKLTLPRTEGGSVDVPATTQLLADVVERWVREDPGQWMWFHKRWEISGRRRRRRGQAKAIPGKV